MSICSRNHDNREQNQKNYPPLLSRKMSRYSRGKSWTFAKDREINACGARETNWMTNQIKVITRSRVMAMWWSSKQHRKNTAQQHNWVQCPFLLNDQCFGSRLWYKQFFSRQKEHVRWKFFVCSSIGRRVRCWQKVFSLEEAIYSTTCCTTLRWMFIG